MKNPHVRPSLLIMTAFVFMTSLGSSWSCDTKFDLPLFLGPNIPRMRSASDKVIATLPEISNHSQAFSPDMLFFKALGDVFSFLKGGNVYTLENDGIESKRAEDTLRQLEVPMIEVQKKVISILNTQFSADVKKKDCITAMNLCEKTYPLFSESASAFNEAKVASSPFFVAFATVYLTVAHLENIWNPQNFPKVKTDMQRMLDDLAEYAFGVQPQRKVLLKKKGSYIHDGIADEQYDISCLSEWRQELSNGIKKFFSPVKERIASFLGVPVPVKYQYYTLWGEECYYRCGYFGENYSWCWRLSGFGTDWDYCSAEKDVTRYGVKCKSDHSCGWHKENYYWCYTGSSWPWNWDYCSPITIQ